MFLPGAWVSRADPSQSIRLVPPFQWVDDVRRESHHSGLSIAHGRTTPAFEGVALNVLLLGPSGIVDDLIDNTLRAILGWIPGALT